MLGNNPGEIEPKVNPKDYLLSNSSELNIEREKVENQACGQSLESIVGTNNVDHQADQKELLLTDNRRDSGFGTDVETSSSIEAEKLGNSIHHHVGQNPQQTSE